MVRTGANDNRAAVYARATSFAVVARGISIACIGLLNGRPPVVWLPRGTRGAEDGRLEGARFYIAIGLSVVLIEIALILLLF